MEAWRAARIAELLGKFELKELMSWHDLNSEAEVWDMLLDFSDEVLIERFSMVRMSDRRAFDAQWNKHESIGNTPIIQDIIVIISFLVSTSFLSLLFSTRRRKLPPSSLFCSFFVSLTIRWMIWSPACLAGAWRTGG